MRPTYPRGQVYPLFGIMLVVLIGVSALSVDMGYYRYQQRAQQSATDSAAIAAGQASFYDSSNSANPQNAAVADATKNGYTDGSGTVVVSAVSHTDAGNCPASANCIGVTITKSYPVFFGSIFKGFANNKGQRVIKTFAAAKLAAVAGSCLTSVGPITVQTTKNGNGGGIAGHDCGIADTDCTDVNGNGNDLDVQSWTENASCGSNKCAIASGSCTVGLPPVDPCSVTPQCQKLASATNTELGLDATGTTCTGTTNPTTTTPYTSGCYNDITFSGKLNSGLYVLTGTTTLGDVTGTGVTLYLAKDATLIKENGKGNGSATFSAPAIGTGDYSVYGQGEEGVVFYQAFDSSNLWSLKLNYDITLTGLAYLPNMTLESNGHAVTVTGNLAAYAFTLDGNGKGGITLNPGAGTDTATPEVSTLAE